MSVPRATLAIHGPLARARWLAKRCFSAARWHLGVAGLAALAASGLAALALHLQWREASNLVELETLERARIAVPAPAPRVDGRAGLKRFDAALPSHEGIADVLRHLHEAARREKLELARGDYTPSEDNRGAFLRYRMVLPLTGEPGAVHRFMLAALKEHKTLALQSVQFRREQVASPVIEAKIAWTLFAQLPGAADSQRPVRTSAVAQSGADLGSAPPRTQGER